MKSRFILPFLLFIATVLSALAGGYTVTVYGILVDVKGNGIKDRVIYISSTKNSKFFVATKTSTEATGAFKSTVDLNDSVQAGALLLSYVNCEGKEITVEEHFNKQKPIIQTLLIYCDKSILNECVNSIVVKRINDSVSIAIAVDKGHGPFKHKWNTGQEGDTIRFKTMTDHKICLVSIDSKGCIAENCVPQNQDCKTEIETEKLNDSVGIAIAHSKGKGPFKYKWTNGSENDTTRYHLTNSLGLCVVSIDSSGCISKACTPNIIRCASAVIVRRMNDSTAVARVIAQGKGPFKHIWTTGAIGDSITFNPLNKIKICVKSTDTSGCVTEACVLFIPEVCSGSIERRGNMLFAFLKGEIAKSYSWSNGSDDPKITIKEKGEYCVVMHGILGCETKVCYTVKEIDTTECKAEIVAQKLYVAAVDMLPAYKLSIVAKFPLKFIKWNTGDTSADIVVRKPGEYCVIISDNIQCKLNVCKKIEFDPAPCALKIQKDELPATSNTALKKVKLTAVTTFNPSLYYWSTNETTKSITVEKSGKYCVTVSDGISCKLQECVEIDLGPPPPNPGECVSSIVVYPISASEVKLVPRVSGLVPFSFLWTTGSKDATINVKTSGIYCVIIKDGKGCTSKACVEISFDKPGSAVLPPTGEQKIAGLTPLTNKPNIELNVFPNPAQNSVNYSVKSKQDKDGTLSISNMYGRLVYQEKIKFQDGISKGDLDLSFLGAGIYEVTILQDGFMKTNKIIMAK